ncbi:MAG: class A beta-lactamase [Gemmatimonadetes bacterium]|nr:class A beta-lactamase [Gemmatimonadota bacterium]
MHNRKQDPRSQLLAAEMVRGVCLRVLARTLLLFTFALPIATLEAQTTPVPPSEIGRNRLQNEIGRLAELSGGKMGVAAIHLESGREVYLNPSEPFPMASSYKVPIAVQLLTRVDRGQVRLDSMITLQPGDLHPGSGTLTQLFDDPGVVLSLRNLTELMLLISDNSATDLVLKAAGGPQAVTARMRQLGFSAIRVDRPTVGLIADWIGIKRLPGEDVGPKQFNELARSVSEADQKAAAAAFDADPRDTSTPQAMVRLLEMIWHRRTLSPGSSELLLDIMRRSTTGTERIKGLLPPGVEVAHKTGTIGGTTNDVGIVKLPDGAGHVALVVFVKESTRDVPARERAIAQISRALYDYFLFSPATHTVSSR